MIKGIGAQIGLLAFGAAILAGLWAGNSPTTVMLRAVAALIIAFGVGQFGAWAVKLILADYLREKKLQIDREHIEALKSIREHEPEAEATVEAR
jgi:hypothetical protein